MREENEGPCHMKWLVTLYACLFLNSSTRTSFECKWSGLVWLSVIHYSDWIEISPDRFVNWHFNQTFWFGYRSVPLTTMNNVRICPLFNLERDRKFTIYHCSMTHLAPIQCHQHKLMVGQFKGFCFYMKIW